MYDCNDKFEAFFNDKIFMSRKDKEDVIAAKELNCELLKQGLEELRKSNAKIPYVKETLVQGSHATHTMIHNAAQEYDIDIAIVFDKSDIQLTDNELKRMVCEALTKSKRNFNIPPQIRKNAITVWYNNGYHIDFAIYRRVIDLDGQYNYEHLGETWSSRDPRAFTQWFNNVVKSKSPSSSAYVQPDQLRRIVMLFKYFCHSRFEWSLPGGIVLTTLATKFYIPDSTRDDISFYRTIEQIYNYLKESNRNLIIYNESAPSNPPLTYTDEHIKKMVRLREKLSYFFSSLSILNDISCSESEALNAWNVYFNRTFSSDTILSSSYRTSPTNNISQCGYRLSACIGDETEIYQQDVPSNHRTFPKGLRIKFILQGPQCANEKIVWTVQNSGDEASEANVLEYSVRNNSRNFWRFLQYKGKHKLICQISRPGFRQINLEYIVNVA